MKRRTHRIIPIFSFFKQNSLIRLIISIKMVNAIAYVQNKTKAENKKTTIFSPFFAFFHFYFSAFCQFHVYLYTST